MCDRHLKLIVHIKWTSSISRSNQEYHLVEVMNHMEQKIIIFNGNSHGSELIVYRQRKKVEC